jgi:COP9 signalosome complex subunit 3
MQPLVTSITKLSGNADDLGKLRKKFEEKGVPKLLKKSVGDIDAALQGLLNPSQHTYGYCMLLGHKAATEIKNHNLFIDQARRIMNLGDPAQIQMAGPLFAAICRQLMNSHTFTGKWIKSLRPLQSAVDKSQTRPGMLTPAHSVLLFGCIKSKHYGMAKTVLEDRIYEVDPNGNGLESLDYLQYFYYGGMVHCALKEWSQALEMFQMALVVPSSVLSWVQVESFKKYVLASLMVHGELVGLPQSTSPIVHQHVEKLCSPYVDFAKAFKKGDVGAAERLIGEHHQQFSKESNMGMIKQALRAMVRVSIRRLTNTFVTLSLRDIADKGKLQTIEDAEHQVRSMVQAGVLFAKIDQRDGMIRFLEDDEDYQSVEIMAQLDKKVREVAAINEKLEQADRDLRLNVEYLKRTMPAEKSAAEKEEDELKMALAHSQTHM